MNLDLAFHRDREEDQEVNDQDGPKYGDVKHVEHCTGQRDEHRLRRAPPGDDECVINHDDYL